MPCFGRRRGAASLLSQISSDNKDLTLPIDHVCNLVFHCWQWTVCLDTLDNTQALGKQACRGPLAPGSFCEREMGGTERWRPSGARGPSQGFQHPSGRDDARVRCRAVRFAAPPLALLQATLLSIVGRISLRVSLLFSVFRNCGRWTPEYLWGVYKKSLWRAEPPSPGFTLEGPQVHWKSGKALQARGTLRPRADRVSSSKPAALPRGSPCPQGLTEHLEPPLCLTQKCLWQWRLCVLGDK